MTQQVFEVGQSVIRVGKSTRNTNQGDIYEVSFMSASGLWIEVVGCEDALDACTFRPAINIKPIPTEDTPMQDIEINTLRNSIVALETELGDTKDELEKMNKWWYDEKTKCEALRELVVKQATKLMA